MHGPPITMRADRVATVPGDVYNGGTYVAAQLLVEALVDTIQGAG